MSLLQVSLSRSMMGRWVGIVIFGVTLWMSWFWLRAQDEGSSDAVSMSPDQKWIKIQENSKKITSALETLEQELKSTKARIGK